MRAFGHYICDLAPMGLIFSKLDIYCTCSERADRPNLMYSLINLFIIKSINFKLIYILNRVIYNLILNKYVR